MIEILKNLINKIKPEIIYCPFIQDVHSDHTVVAKAVMSYPSGLDQISKKNFDV